MKKILMLGVLSVSLFATQAFAHCTNSAYYGGGGIGFNSLPRHDGTTGAQIIGGYCLPYKFDSRKVKSSLELGYMDMGEFDNDNNNNNEQDVQGIWSAGVLEYKSTPQIHFLGRLGYDFGDDDGVLFGGGMAFNVSKYAQIRSEYVIRDETKSLQFNLITEF